MILSYCYICNSSLEGDNKSFEHIIPNSIGGFAGSYNLLCRNCNTKLGLEIEGDFAKSLNPLCALLQIKRDRKNFPHIKNLKDKDGNLYNLHNGRKPIKIKPQIQKLDSNYFISARDIKEATHIIQKLKAKEPTLEIDNWEQKLVETKTRMREPLHFQLNFGGVNFFRTIAKIGVNSYLHLGGDRKYINTAVKYIGNPQNAHSNLIHYHVEPNPTMTLEPLEVCHCIYIKGNKERKILFVYIELFNTLSFVLKLSDNFDGDDFEKTYCIDVIEGKQVDKKITVKYPEGASPEGYKPHDEVFFPVIQSKMSRLMKVAQVQQVKMTFKDEYAELWKECQKNYDDDPINNKKQSIAFLENVTTLLNDLLNQNIKDENIP
ncbi:MAG: hypothetical protein H6550_02010 [Chitinophagales bacterium]|nr:hypothetical protein [Chitinophagales bacterium]